jgi:uncharacterized protein (UPF0548 family)
MLIGRRGDPAALRRALARAVDQLPNWQGDADAVEHPGFHVTTYRSPLGSGDEAFAGAVDTVMTWGVQRGAGLTVLATDARAAVGATVIVGLPIGPVLVLAPRRVTEVFDSPARGGFRYVTLPDHPENGFEEFIVERSTDGEVWFVVRPVSRPGSVLTRLAGPVGRQIQRRAGGRYLKAINPTARAAM